MATKPRIQTTLEFRVQAIQRLFHPDTVDISFSFVVLGDDQKQQTMLIKAHRTLLSARSIIFRTMFSSKWKNSTILQISHVSIESFHAFIGYFYTENIQITVVTAADILWLSHMFRVPRLTTICSQFLTEHVAFHNAVNYLSLAVLISLDNLKLKCLEFISENTAAVLESEVFLQCSHADLYEILSINSSNCPEEIIFVACVRWATSKCAEQNIDQIFGQNLRYMLGDCFALIRFREMHGIMLIFYLDHYKDMFTANEIFELSNQNSNECRDGYRFKPKPHDPEGKLIS